MADQPEASPFKNERGRLNKLVQPRSRRLSKQFESREWNPRIKFEEVQGCVALILLSCSITLIVFTIQVSLDPLHKKSNLESFFLRTDSDSPNVAEDIHLGDLVTVVIKTFERPECLKRCVTHIRYYYPEVPILVVDDSITPEVGGWLATDPHIEYHKLPYHSGAGFGRNYMTQHTRTPYLLTVDDDFIFTNETDIEFLLRVSLEAGADIVAANLFERNTFRGFDSMLLMNDTLYVFPNATTYDGRYNGCVRTDFAIQFFLAKTEALIKAQWDASLKTAEHEDWMLQVQKQNLVVYTCPQVRALHSPNTGKCVNSQNYNSHRLATEPFVLKTMEKWNIKSIEENYEIITRDGRRISTGRGEWTAIPQDRLAEVAERAVFLMNMGTPNWQKRTPQSFWGGWERHVGKYGYFRSLWVDTLYKRPKQFYRGEKDRPEDRIFRIVYKEQPDDLDLLFRYTHLIYQYNIPRRATVHIVMALRDNGPTLKVWLRRLRNIKELGDENFRVVVADFHSTDCDVKEELERSGLHYKLLLHEGPFCRSQAMNMAISSIDEENPLIFVLDASIVLPYGFLDKVRSYVVPGKKVYFPIYNGLHNHTHIYESNPESYWIDYGFGQAAFYRKDFDLMGGYDSLRWGCLWGGEDLDLADHFIEADFLVHRTYEFSLFHVPHKRVGGYKKEKNHYDKREPIAPHTERDPLMFPLPEVERILQKYGKLPPGDNIRVYGVEVLWRPGEGRYPRKYYDVYYLNTTDDSRWALMLHSDFVPHLHEVDRFVPEK